MKAFCINGPLHDQEVEFTVNTYSFTTSTETGVYTYVIDKELNKFVLRGTKCPCGV